MATIMDRLPKFHQIEPNILKGLHTGFVVAQSEIASGATFPQEKFNLAGADMESGSVTKSKLIANGHVVQWDGKEITDTKAATGALYLVYNDPIVTVGNPLAVRYYATDTDEECLRLVLLIPGDQWMSDIDLLDVNYPGHEHFAGRIVKVAEESGWNSVSDLADGTPAFHYAFLG